MPPWISFDDWLEVWAAKSPASHSPTSSPRKAASRAAAAPVAPPPTISRSKGRAANLSSAARRRAAGVMAGGGRSFLERDVQLVELLLRHRTRRLRHQVGALLRLRERDHVAQRIGAAQEHGQPIDAGCDAAVGRGAVLERLQQEPELRLRVLVAEAERAKHARLDVGAVDTDRPAR